MTTKKHTEISDAEEARIQKLIASDPESPELTDAQIAAAKPFAEAFPEVAQTMRKNLGGRPKSASPKVGSGRSCQIQGNGTGLAEPHQ